MENGIPKEPPQDQVDDECQDAPTIESAEGKSDEVQTSPCSTSNVLQKVRHNVYSLWTARPKWQKWLTVSLFALLVIVPMKRAFNDVFEPHRLYDGAFRRIKNAIVQGPRDLLRQFPEDMVMDFREGSLVLGLSGSSVSASEPRQLQITSIEDPARMLTMTKDESNIVRFRLDYPSLGCVERSAQLKVNDIESREWPFGGMVDIVFVAFTWNLDKPESSLYVNGKDVSNQEIKQGRH